MSIIWFVSHYSMPPQYEMRIKTQKYAENLQKMGHKCLIFSASTIHNTKINLINGKDKYVSIKYGDLDFVHIKCSDYSGNGIKRIINMRQFAHRFAKYANKFVLPDYIVADANCVNYGPMYKFAKKHHIPFYIDMRDLWPMSIVEYYKYSETNPIIKYLYHKERIMYRNVDGVIFSMPGGKEYIKDKGWCELDLNKFYYINNGVEIDSFYKQINEFCFDDSDLSSSDFKVVYTGSIRTANNLMAIILAADKLKKYSNIKFLLYGDGDDKKNLEDYCAKNQINNVIFKGMVEKKCIPFILSKCNLSILNYKKAKTLKYGGSQNKLFEYLAAGCPVLLTVEMNYNLVKERNCGIAIDNPEPDEIANAILKMYSKTNEELKVLSDNAKKVAEEFDFKVLTKKLESILKGDKYND